LEYKNNIGIMAEKQQGKTRQARKGTKAVMEGQ